ncbi:FK506-binding protein 2-like [Stylophora pistillata]|uniref:peptidylprolyl isomerase n=1 Tax=Stylophora pistillata TaxID=50429 RepID=A0A2B4S448_STYPI|nr:FK506-binding protein 2-like [Stylophora pistillata]PFX23367.1 Peptidyl-prolyl cis-trans isomerase FKBP14 [Stylophora pistillata]
MWFTEWMNLLVLLAFFSTLCCGEEEGVTIEVVYKPEGCTRKTKDGDLLAMDYTGRLEKDGSVFDSSHKRQQTFDFTMGKGQVIQGWEEGLKDMCVGEKRKLRVPAHLGYGDRGAGDVIPPGANLLFDVELKEIKNDGEVESEAYPNVFNMIDADKNKELSIEEVKQYLKEQNGYPNEDENQHETIVSEIFEHEDKDKDGVISHEEFSGPKQDHVEL